MEQPQDSRPALARACPHLDRDDARCQSRFGIARLDQVFSVCLGTYAACPMFHLIRREDDTTARSRRERAPFITVTAHGRPLPLRPTGT